MFTTLLAADRLGRDSVGLELSEPYIKLAHARLRNDAPMLVEEDADADAPRDSEGHHRG